MGMLLQLRDQAPQTKFWIDSIIDADIDFALANGSFGITTAPSITAFAVKNDRERWLEMMERNHLQHPEFSERKLLWKCMYEAAAEAAAKLEGLFDGTRFGMDGHFAIQANIYDFNNADKIRKQAEVIHSLGKNFIIKIPTTQAGLKAIEDVVASGHSVLATSCVSVSQVISAAEALERGYQRYMKTEGANDGGLCLSIAMQVAWQDMCFGNYAKVHGISLSEQSAAYAGIAVAKKAYRVLKEKYPRVAFMLSNLKTEQHIREFIGGDLIMTIPGATQRKVDTWDAAESFIDRPVADVVMEELLEKIPFYRMSYQEDGMTEEQYAKCIPFCRVVNDFINGYEEAVRVARNVIVPNLYGNDTVVSY